MIQPTPTARPTYGPSFLASLLAGALVFGALACGSEAGNGDEATSSTHLAEQPDVATAEPADERFDLLLSVASESSLGRRSGLESYLAAAEGAEENSGWNTMLVDRYGTETASSVQPHLQTLIEARETFRVETGNKTFESLEEAREGAEEAEQELAAFSDPSVTFERRRLIVGQAFDTHVDFGAPMREGFDAMKNRRVAVIALGDVRPGEVFDYAATSRGYESIGMITPTPTGPVESMETFEVVAVVGPAQDYNDTLGIHQAKLRSARDAATQLEASLRDAGRPFIERVEPALTAIGSILSKPTP